MQFFTDDTLSSVRGKMVEAGRTGHICKVLAIGNYALKREKFDPANSEHRQVYADFLVTGRWNGRSFFIETPAITVPRTCERKLVDHFLKQELATARQASQMAV
jgi:hypothetical protein